jgi:predicted dehydrogenase
MHAERKTRVAVIGVGAQGALHLAAYAALETVEVAAVCDADGERAATMAQRFGVPHWTTAYQDLLAMPDLDLVSVATPEGQHVGPVLASLDAGKHVLVEKPIALDPAEAAQLFARARARRRFLMPAHVLRFDPRYALLKERLGRGDLGRIISITARRNLPRVRAAAFHRVSNFAEVLIHDIDIALWLTGSHPVRAYGVHCAPRAERPPDAVHGILHLADGTVVLLSAHWMVPGSHDLFVEAATEVLAEHGVAQVSYPGAALTLTTDTIVEQPDTTLWPLTHGHLGGALFAEVAYFVRCVRRGEEPTLIAEAEALAGLRAARALQQSAELNREVPVPV